MSSSFQISGLPLDCRALEDVLERRQRSADDAHPVQMGERNELVVTVNDVVRRWRGLVWRQNTAKPADVVDAHHQYYNVRVQDGSWDIARTRSS